MSQKEKPEEMLKMMIADYETQFKVRLERIESPRMLPDREENDVVDTTIQQDMKYSAELAGVPVKIGLSFSLSMYSRRDGKQITEADNVGNYYGVDYGVHLADSEYTTVEVSKRIYNPATRQFLPISYGTRHREL